MTCGWCMRVVSLVFTSLRFAPASALLIQFLSRVQRHRHSEKDPMGSFSNPFGAVRAGFDNRCRIKRVQGVRVRSDHTDITCIYRTCRDSEGSYNMVPKMAKVNIFCYTHLLNRFRVNKGYTCKMFCVLYLIAFSLLCRVTRTHSQ